MKPTNASYYNLPSRVVLRAVGENHVAIVKLIKSRIIQKDALKIAAIAAQIKSVDPALEVTLICTRNICSKSIALLEREGVTIELLD